MPLLTSSESRRDPFEPRRGVSESRMADVFPLLCTFEPRRGCSEQRRDLSESRRGVSEPRRGVSESRRGCFESRRDLSEPRRGSFESRRGLSESRCEFAEPRRMVSESRIADKNPLLLPSEPRRMVFERLRRHAEAHRPQGEAVPGGGILKRFNHSAQGCAPGATLGQTGMMASTLKGLPGFNPFRVGKTGGTIDPG